jgi:hypothetical protein
MRICPWSDWQHYQRLVTRYFGRRVLMTDRAEWSILLCVTAYLLVTLLHRRAAQEAA